MEIPCCEYFGVDGGGPLGEGHVVEEEVGEDERSVDAAFNWGHGASAGGEERAEGGEGGYIAFGGKDGNALCSEGGDGGLGRWGRGTGAGWYDEVLCAAGGHPEENCTADAAETAGDKVRGIRFKGPGAMGEEVLLGFMLGQWSYRSYGWDNKVTHRNNILCTRLNHYTADILSVLQRPESLLDLTGWEGLYGRGSGTSLIHEVHRLVQQLSCEFSVF